MEKLNKLYNSFKTGIITWIFAYFIFYVVAVYVNDINSYNTQILKMTNGMNFFIQAVISGIFYMILEIIIFDFVNRIVKSVDAKNVKECVTTLLIAFVLLGIELFLSSLIIIEDIISEEISTILIGILVLKGVFYIIYQNITSYKINKKLNQSN